MLSTLQPPPSAPHRCAPSRAGSCPVAASVQPAPAGRSRRALGAAVLLLAGASSSWPAAAQEEEQVSPLIARLKAKSDSLREERRVERLDAYNRRNFSDYMEFELGSGRKGPVQDEMREWLAKPKATKEVSP